jgi:hypothetical protein
VELWISGTAERAFGMTEADRHRHREHPPTSDDPLMSGFGQLIEPTIVATLPRTDSGSGALPTVVSTCWPAVLDV